MGSKWADVQFSAYLYAMEFAGDVAGIIICIVRCPTSAKNVDEYYLAWVSEFQPVYIYHSRSDRIKFQKQFLLTYTQHRVDPTGGSLRVFGYFAWLRAFFVSRASPPSHPPADNASRWAAQS